MGVSDYLESEAVKAASREAETEGFVVTAEARESGHLRISAASSREGFSVVTSIDIARPCLDSADERDRSIPFAIHYCVKKARDPKQWLNAPSSAMLNPRYEREQLANLIVSLVVGLVLALGYGVWEWWG